jgi:aminoglycoside 6-adenylyltransferase
MTATDKLLKSIQRWAKNEDAIHTLILLGSHAVKGKTDRLSDLDLAIFVEDPALFMNEQDWFRSFAPVWNVVSERDEDWQSWLVIYEGGAMADFTFYPLDSLDRMQEALPEHFEAGYKILVDKHKLARKLPKASGAIQSPPQPTADAFSDLFDHYWYHAYHVAKYLWRGDLWRAKHYDWALKQNLLKMMGWYASLCLDVRHFTLYEGRQL